MSTKPRKRAGFGQGIYAQSATQKERLGTVRELDDGRTFVYCKNGAVALAPGAVCASVITSGMNEQTVTVAHPVGTTNVTITDSGAGTAANAYADGRLVVTAGAGIGESYKIISNSAAAAGLTFEVVLDNGLLTAWNIATTDVTLYVNKYNGVVVNPTDGQQIPACVPQRSVTASYFFWGQVLGDGAMLIDVAGGAAGTELDEKLIRPSLNHAGYGFINAAPDAAAILAGYRHTLGYIIDEADITDNEAVLVQIRIGL
jgi:hypothetical protein